MHKTSPSDRRRRAARLRRFENRYAAREGIHTLYKFRPYDTPEHREWVRQILVEGRFYLPSASQLDDDADLRPMVRVRRMPNEATTRRVLLKDGEKSWKRHTPPHSADTLVRLRRRLQTIPLEELEREAVQRTHERLESDYWILSFATSRDWLHMWNDYADHARGLCIHLRSDDSSPFGLAQRVLYKAARPAVWVPVGSDREVADAATLTKTLKWKDQSEYRFIRYPDTSFTEIGLRLDGRYLYFPRTLITGITIGHRMPESHIQEIEAMTKGALGPHVPIYVPKDIEEGNPMATGAPPLEKVLAT